MRVRIAGAGLAAFLLTLLPSPVAHAQSRQVSAENRLFIRYVEDAAVVPSFWLEGQAIFTLDQGAFDDSVRGAGEANQLTIKPVFAFNVAEDFEFGGRIGIAYRDPDNGGSDTGLTDTDVWGKLSISTEPVLFSLGILLQLPTGNEDDFFGTGEVDVEFFGGLRKDFSWVSLSGNLGVRINQDPDFGVVELEGESSLLGGFAAQFPVGNRWVLTVEWAIESERYDGLGTDSRLLGGFDLGLGESLMVRGAVAAGLSDAAPGTAALGSLVWLF
jgi:hypothetical protein